MATELAKAYVQIIPSAEGISGKLGSIMGGEAQSAGTTAGTGFASFFTKALGAAGIAAAAGKLAQAVGETLKQAVTQYADYEQLTGGVETLFKGSADTIMGYAENAYRTAGLSANEYMETVTSFSASLLQSLGGDTEAAAQYADMAVTDMADNANKMGSSMESIQNAYQGFAKQNFTMLDNLKLGYGGTKTEMERLLADAERIQKANGVMAEYSVDSFGDIVEAIHVVQEEMGVAGTTALEAAETISGSVGMTKAAWTNLLTGLADENADVKGLVDDLVESARLAAGNLAPAISQGIKGMLQAGRELLPEFLDLGLEFAGSLLDGLLEGAPEWAKELVRAGEDALGNFLGLLETVGDTLLDAFGDVEPLIKTASEGMEKHLSGAASALGALRDAAATDGTFIHDVLQTLGTFMKEIFTVGAESFKLSAEIAGAAFSMLADCINAISGATRDDGDGTARWMLETATGLGMLKNATQGLGYVGDILGELSTRVENLRRNVHYALVEAGLIPSTTVDAETGFSHMTGSFGDAADGAWTASEALTDVEESMDQTAEAADEEAEAFAEATKSLGKLGLEAFDAIGSGGNLRETYNDLSKELEKLKEEGDPYIASLAEQALEALNLAATNQELAEGYPGLMERIAEMGPTLSQTSQWLIDHGITADEWGKQVDSATKGVVNSFKEMDTDLDMTVEEMAANLQANITATQEWNSNMAALWAAAAASGQAGATEFVQYLQDMGPAAATQVAAMAGDVEGTLATFAPMFATAADAGIMEVFNGIQQGQPLVTEAAAGLGSGIPEGLSQQAAGVEGAAGEIITSITTALSGGAEQISTVATEAGTAYAEGLSSQAEQVGSASGELVDRSIQAWTGRKGDFTTTGSQSAGALASGLRSGRSGVYSAGRTAALSGLSGASAVSFYSTGYSMAQGLASGIYSGAGLVRAAAVSAATTAYNAARAALDINSPSKVFRDEIGMAIPEGLAAGIYKGRPFIEDAVRAMTRSTMDAYRMPELGTVQASRAQSNVTMNVYASRGMDENALARKTIQALNTLLNQKEAAYA